MTLSSVDLERDLMELTAALMAVASESFDESRITDLIEGRLRELEHLEVVRIGDNLVARTALGRPTRVVLAGHTDTVPANGNSEPKMDNDVLHGLGSADMKGGLAVMLAMASKHVRPAVDVTLVFYAREEVAAVHSGLGELFETRPELLAGDLAVLGEPTGGNIEAGCQGNLRFQLTLRGARAHIARAWMGTNAIHRVAPVLSLIAEYRERRPEIAGCQFHEALQVVRIEGGVAGNVVPDVATIDLTHRFAPDRSIDDAVAHVKGLIGPLLGPQDELKLIDVAPAAYPAADHPLVKRLVDAHGLNVNAKLGWTDVARFAEHGIPAVNLGPGDPTLAHTKDERVDRASLERTAAIVDDLLSFAAPGPDYDGDAK